MTFITSCSMVHHTRIHHQLQYASSHPRPSPAAVWFITPTAITSCSMAHYTLGHHQLQYGSSHPRPSPAAVWFITPTAITSCSMAHHTLGHHWLQCRLLTPSAITSCSMGSSHPLPLLGTVRVSQFSELYTYTKDPLSFNPSQIWTDIGCESDWCSSLSNPTT